MYSFICFATEKFSIHKRQKKSEKPVIDIIDFK